MEIAQEYEALVQFLYMAPVGLIQSGLDGEIAMINPLSAQLLMPLSPDGNLSNLFVALESVAPDLRHLVAGFGASFGMVCDGVRIPLMADRAARSQPSMLSLTLLKLDEHRLMAVVNDITQQVARERVLKQNEAWLNAIMMGVTDYALIRLDGGGCVVDWNPSIGRITGFQSRQIVGQPFSIFYPAGGTTTERMADRLREADESGWSLDEGWRAKADGNRFWGSAMITPLDARDDLRKTPTKSTAFGRTSMPDELPRDSASPAYSLVIRDITDQREGSQRQRAAIACDHLTGIANRRTFFETAELEFARGHRHPRQLSLLMFDLDHFKRVNDAHGHAAGDAVLKDFAALLTATFREVDVVSRIGGEEFAVLLPSTDRDQAQASAERLRLTASLREVRYEGTTLGYSVSAGFATVDSEASNLETLMKRADQALYVAKAAGRNQTAEWQPRSGDQ